jgi:hypothetical protein
LDGRRQRDFPRERSEERRREGRQIRMRSLNAQADLSRRFVLRALANEPQILADPEDMMTLQTRKLRPPTHWDNFTHCPRLLVVDRGPTIVNLKAMGVALGITMVRPPGLGPRTKPRSARLAQRLDEADTRTEGYSRERKHQKQFRRDSAHRKDRWA